ncbi:uncharacterized protein [Pithys albifrons albifrons]|uniref:uncharacterized protein n=1 Tax=Pithys albifrons albifrons TaxID=3385563 RepID=UPI003A5CF215
MAELTLGQMLDMAIGAPKTEPIDFEQLRNLLNGMLMHLGLRDLPIQESGEPLEGTPSIPSPASVAADIEMLKQNIEANEKEIAEVRALCEELRVEINEIKEEQSHMAENMQKMQESLDPANLQDMLDNLRNELSGNLHNELSGNLHNELSDNLCNELSDTAMSSVKDMTGQDGQVSSDWQPGPGMRPHPWNDHGLVVIGNEMTLVQRFGATSPKPDTSASSPVPWKSKARAQTRGKDSLPRVMSSPQPTFMASDTGWNDVGWNNMGPIEDEEMKTGISKGVAFPSSKAWSRGKNLLPGATSSHRVSFTGSDIGWNDMGQMKDKEIKTGISKGMALPSSQAWSRKNLLHGVTSSPRAGFVESDEAWSDVEQIEDEEIQTSISKAEALPSPLGAFPEMNDMEEIKDKVTEMSISKRKSLDGSATAPGVRPGSPSTHGPRQQVQSVGHHPASQTLWIPAESVAGTDRFLTAKEAQGGGSFRMEPSQIEPGMKLLKMSSLEYLPCDQPFTTQLPGPYSPPGSPSLTKRSPPGSPPVSGRSPPSPGSPALPRRSDIVSFTPPPSPGLTGRLPHLAEQEHGPRGQAADGYFRRSPMYCGGRHTSLCPVQRMEPLLPDPNKPGVFDLVGRDGFIYRGRHSTAPTGSWMEEASFSNLQ